MEMKELGEFGLIDLIGRDTVCDASSVALGIGDDAAAYRPTAGMLELVSTDMLVEGVHFDLSFTNAFQLGYKSLAVNFSDIAAMGGAPKQAVVSIAIPGRMEPAFVVELYRGMKKIARDFRVNIVGGDTVSSPGGLVINAAVIGEVSPDRLVKRSGASVGDLVAVTGSLGNSAAGLCCLQQGKQAFDFAEDLVREHLTPLPQVAIAPVIAKYASSMNDISDGLASETNEIAKASQVGIRIWAEQIPLSPSLKKAAAVFQQSALDFALYGGEDYQLVFTIAQEKYGQLRAALPALTVIGEVTRGANAVELVHGDARIVKLEARGYNHFR